MMEREIGVWMNKIQKAILLANWLHDKHWGGMARRGSFLVSVP